MFKITAAEKQWLIKRRRRSVTAMKTVPYPKLDKYALSIAKKAATITDGDYDSLEDGMIKLLGNRVDAWLSKMNIESETLYYTEDECSIHWQLYEDAGNFTIRLYMEEGTIRAFVDDDEMKVKKNFVCTLSKPKPVLSSALAFFSSLVKSW